MSDSSALLSLPYLMPAQAQKHVTHNEAIRMLDVFVQLTVEGFGATVPPVAPDRKSHTANPTQTRPTISLSFLIRTTRPPSNQKHILRRWRRNEEDKNDGIQGDLVAGVGFEPTTFGL